MMPLQVPADVMCVGQAVYDLTMMVDNHPGPDEKCFASRMYSCGGGPAANAAVTVARLGGTAAFGGYVGCDLYGEIASVSIWPESSGSGGDDYSSSS